MLEWMTRPRWTRQTELAAGTAITEPSGVAGRSAPLHKYLDDRYAGVVVLTFGEIEDLIGCALPELARVSTDWWTRPAPDAGHSRFADSWILARRTARPNLRALTVAFERAS
jgi:hypothetical protein